MQFIAVEAKDNDRDRVIQILYRIQQFSSLVVLSLIRHLCKHILYYKRNDTFTWTKKIVLEV